MLFIIIGVFAIIAFIIYTFFFPDTKEILNEVEEWDDELISDPETGQYLTLEQAQKGLEIDSPDNDQVSQELINKPQEVLEIFDFLSGYYDENSKDRSHN